MTVRNGVQHTDRDKDSEPLIRILKGRKNAIAEAYLKSSQSKNAIYCITGKELSESYKPFLQLANSKIQNGGSVRILTDISHDSDVYGAVSELLTIGVQIRHSSSPYARRCVIYDAIAFFSVSNTPRLTPSNVERLDPDDLWIASTDIDVVEIAKKQFESQWAGGVDALERMSNLKSGEIEENTLIVKDNQKAMELYKFIAATTSQEAMWILPSAKSVLRVKAAGILDILVSAAMKGASVRILCPQDDSNSNLIKDLVNLTPTLEIKNFESRTTTLLIVNRRLLFTSELRNNDTDDIHEALSMSVYSNSKPTVQSHITLFEALWRQEEAYEQLAAAYRIKEDFISIAAHELRTPILPIFLAAESLQKAFEKHGSNEQSEGVKIIVRNVNRLKNLINNVLDATRVENKSFILNRKRVEMSQFIRTIIADETIKLSRDSEVRIEFQDSLPAGFQSSFDKERLGQVIHNLIDNAIKFTSAGSVTITAGLAEEDDHDVVTIAVKDAGKGIDPEIFDKLFTRFTTKSINKAGTGLGLYVSRAIVEAHDGTITAKNSEEGGATFTIRLPHRLD